MDNADVIHRVLENKQSLLELHSADGAPFYFTYTKVVILINTSYKYNAASRSYTKFIFATWQSLVTSLKSGPSCRTGRPTLEICTHKDSWVSSSYSIVYPCWWNIWCVYVMFITHPIHALSGICPCKSDRKKNKTGPKTEPKNWTDDYIGLVS